MTAAYFRARWKLLWKQLPYVLPVTALLLAGLLALLAGFLRYDAGREDKQRFAVGVVQETEGESGADGALSMGLAMLQAMDDTRFTLAMEEMDEDTAKKRLEKGEIAAYFVFPAGFAKAAAKGEIGSVRAVFSPETEGLSRLLQEEFTRTAGRLLAGAQKGVSGAEDAAAASGADGRTADGLAMRYISLILNRGSLYRLEQTGVSADGTGLSAAQTGVLSFFVLFLLWMALPFAGGYARGDRSLERQLSSRGIGAGRQVLCLFGTLALFLFLLTALLIGFASLLLFADGAWNAQGGIFSGVRETAGVLLGEVKPLTLLWKGGLALFPAVTVTAALGLMLFSFAGDAVSGILLHFFAVLSMGYLSGCFYPLSAFPAGMQTAGRFLLPAILREWTAAMLRGDAAAAVRALGGILLITAGCLLLTAAVLRRDRRR